MDVAKVEVKVVKRGTLVGHQFGGYSYFVARAGGDAREHASEIVIILDGRLLSATKRRLVAQVGRYKTSQQSRPIWTQHMAIPVPTSFTFKPPKRSAKSWF